MSPFVNKMITLACIYAPIYFSGYMMGRTGPDRELMYYLFLVPAVFAANSLAKIIERGYTNESN